MGERVRGGEEKRSRSFGRREGAAAAAAEELISVHNAGTWRDSGDRECACERERGREGATKQIGERTDQNAFIIDGE